MKKLLITLYSLLLICPAIRAQDDGNYDAIVALAKQSFLRELAEISTERKLLGTRLESLETLVASLERTSPLLDSTRCSTMTQFAFELCDLKLHKLRHDLSIADVRHELISELPECDCKKETTEALEEDEIWMLGFEPAYEVLVMRAARVMPGYKKFLY